MKVTRKGRSKEIDILEKLECDSIDTRNLLRTFCWRWNRIVIKLADNFTDSIFLVYQKWFVK